MNLWQASRSRPFQGVVVLASKQKHFFDRVGSTDIDRVADAILGDEDTAASHFDADEDSWTASAEQAADGAMVDTGKQDWCVHVRWTCCRSP